MGGGVILIIVGYKWGHPKKFQMKKRVIIFYRSYPSKPTSPHPPPSHPMNGPRAKNYQLILIVLSAKPLKFRTYSFSVPLKYRSHNMTS